MDKKQNIQSIEDTFNKGAKRASSTVVAGLIIAFSTVFLLPLYMTYWAPEPIRKEYELRNKIALDKTYLDTTYIHQQVKQNQYIDPMCTHVIDTMNIADAKEYFHIIESPEYHNAQKGIDYVAIPLYGGFALVFGSLGYIGYASYRRKKDIAKQHT